ncbi:MAG: DUF2249 domain-containing protein [Nitrososphaerota archaeon]|jgi:uncharacterized protein (DUF2249 family)/quercetin dioxygenase-like cupin family protein|nr:DUF2249 domain-containing protein [Nitrososphaerota archaeon]
MPAQKPSGQEIDVRDLPPHERHGKVLELFDALKPGETLSVVNDHEPVHLVAFMKHERRDFDSEAYRAYERAPGEWVGIFAKLMGVTGDRAGPVITSFGRERQYSDFSFSPIPVYATPSYRVLLTYIRAGQFIPVHTPNIDLIFAVQSGRGTVVAGSERQRISPGDVIIVPKGVRRGILAETDMEALHVVSPPPGDSDHEEVSRKIAAGSFE